MKENIERYNPNIEEGLSNNQVEKRKKEGLVNFDTTSPTKSIKSIIISNFFTIFNLMNLLLALAVFAVGEYKNMLFIGLVVINTAISTFQEIHSKRVIDKLSLISNTKVNCIRNGKKEKIIAVVYRNIIFKCIYLWWRLYDRIFDAEEVCE